MGLPLTPEVGVRYTTFMRNGCQLIVYPDSIGGDLSSLRRFLSGEAGSALTGVHVLPFYPSSADRGFAPLTYAEVDPNFGSWEDIEWIAREFDLCVDFMLNHISAQSVWFRDYLARGDESEYADMFIRYSRFWPDGAPSDGDLERIYTRKPRPPYREVSTPNGGKERVWCTFDFEQIDLNLASESTRERMAGWLRSLAGHGPAMIRLDAFAYATKKPGTNCFFVQPDVWEILDWSRDVLADTDVDLLPEVHEHYRMQQAISAHEYRVYDFALPMLVLHALYEGRAHRLAHWLTICPRNQVTTLDTHDGIGVVDVADLLTPEEIERTRKALFERGANVKRIYNTQAYGNLDIYQINCTYYSALGERDSWYLLARAIQFFAPGIPHVYYVGLLAGRNDLALVEQTRVGRDINRHNYTVEEAMRELQRPVVSKLLSLMQLRNSSAAFEGTMSVSSTEHGQEHATLLVVRWQNGDEEAVLEADLFSRSFRAWTRSGSALVAEVAVHPADT